MRLDKMAYGAYSLMQACLKGTPVGGGMGGGTIVWELSTETLVAKLKAHGVPESLHGDIDDLVGAAYNEFRSLQGKKAASFNPETELELLGSWPKK